MDNTTYLSTLVLNLSFKLHWLFLFQMVWDLVKTLQSLQGEPRAPIRNEIGHIFLIDREADLVTPLCTQTTYEGLLDETFGIKSGWYSVFVTAVTIFK